MNPALLVQILTIVGLIAVMLSMGLRVTFNEVIASARNPRLVALGIVANFVLVPAVTVGLLSLLAPEPLVSLGFLILAVCPGAPVGPPFAAIAKGDVPCAIGQMVILACLSTLLAPALLSMILPRFAAASDLHIDYLAIVRTLLVAQILPLAVGLGIRHWATYVASRIAKPVGLLANVLLLTVVVLMLVKEFDTLEMIQLRGWIGMLLLLAASLGIGWICGGPGRATRRSMSLTTGIRNAAVALVIVANNFAGSLAVSAVVAYALVSIFGSLGCAFLFGALSNRSD